MTRMLVMTGEGIECEKESVRFFEEVMGLRVTQLPVPRLLKDPSKALEDFKAGDWLMIPGGFSYADHFGSGKLLSYRLREGGILDEALSREMHLLGICNGFQVLTEAGFFGQDTRLLGNRVDDRALGFVNRWTRCHLSWAPGEIYDISLRHGEGRVVRSGLDWPQGVAPFLFYNDSEFSNGSAERIAGLMAKRGKSLVLGMMPHPEVSFRPVDHPDRPGPDFVEKSRSRVLLPTGSGTALMKNIFERVKENA